MRLGVLGSLEVEVDGRTVQVPPGRRRAALACLTIHRGRTVSADALAEAVWGEQQPRDPPAALQTVLSRLRAVLGDVIHRQDRLGYRLDLPPGHVDSSVFEGLLDQVDHGDPDRARHLLEEALALWRGPAYGEFADAPFVLGEAARLNRLRAEATERLAAVATDAGDHTSAVSLAEGLLAEEPFREGAVEVLVTALHRGGRSADALAECRRHRDLLARELGLAPAPALDRLERRILGHDRPPRSAPPRWLDTSTTFVGREDEYAGLLDAVSTNRLTVITGPGGVGKSRLAAKALPALHERCGLPTVVTELASVADGGVALAVATALGLHPSPSVAATDVVVEHLVSTPHLLVIDNCEHRLDEVSALAGRLVTRCRGVRVVATSRRRLGLTSERVLPLAPLPVPAPGEDGRHRLAPSVRLVADRVHRVMPSFTITPENVEVVSELCRRVDGLPLALELAASRVATRGVVEVLAPLATEPTRTVEARLAHVVAWSHELMSPRQQRLLCALSVFPGEFTIHEVRELLAHLEEPVEEVAADLTELVESSLVSIRMCGVGARYRLLSIVRAFAAERLRETGREAAVGAAHASWVAEVTEGIARDWARREGTEVDARLTAACEEVGTAIRWSLGAGRTDLAARIAAGVTACLHWTPSAEIRGLFVEVAERGAEAPAPELAGGVGAGAFVLAEQGDLEGAQRLAQAALGMAATGEEPLTAVLALAVAAMYRGERTTSERWFRRLERAPDLLADASASLALGACYHDDLPAAREHAAVALAAGSCSSAASSAFARFAAGEIAARDDPDVGAELFVRASQEADRVGAEQVGRVARVALLAALTRAGRREEALDLAPTLLSDLRAKGAWVQAWTALRIAAELLEGPRPAEAALALEAAGSVEGSPPPVGHDVPRYADLSARLADRLGEGVMSGITQLARSSPRGQVVGRVVTALTDLTGEGSTAAPGRHRPPGPDALWDT